MVVEAGKNMAESGPVRLEGSDDHYEWRGRFHRRVRFKNPAFTGSALRFFSGGNLAGSLQGGRHGGEQDACVEGLIQQIDCACFDHPVP